MRKTANGSSAPTAAAVTWSTDAAGNWTLARSTISCSIWARCVERTRSVVEEDNHASHLTADGCDSGRRHVVRRRAANRCAASDFAGLARRPEGRVALAHL